MQIIVVALLLFVHLAGQSIDPRLTWPVYGLWLVLGSWALIKRPRFGPPTILGLVALMVSLAAGELDLVWGVRRLLTLLGYGGTFYWLRHQRLNLYPALALAGGLMSMLTIAGVNLGNRNIVAGFIYLSVPVVMIWRDWRRWAGLALGAVALVIIGCRGAWLAAVVAVIVYCRQYYLLTTIPLAAAAVSQLRPSSVADRIQVWERAISHLSVWGHGLGSAIYPSLNGGLFYHTHCLPLTIANEMGVLGLGSLAWGLYNLSPRLKGWQGATLTGLLAWSLIDEVVWFWGPGMVAIYLLVEVMRHGRISPSYR